MIKSSSVQVKQNLSDTLNITKYHFFPNNAEKFFTLRCFQSKTDIFFLHHFSREPSNNKINFLKKKLIFHNSSSKESRAPQSFSAIKVHLIVSSLLINMRWRLYLFASLITPWRWEDTESPPVLGRPDSAHRAREQIRKQSICHIQTSIGHSELFSTLKKPHV